MCTKTTCSIKLKVGRFETDFPKLKYNFFKGFHNKNALFLNLQCLKIVLILFFMYYDVTLILISFDILQDHDCMKNFVIMYKYVK